MDDFVRWMDERRRAFGWLDACVELERRADQLTDDAADPAVPFDACLDSLGEAEAFRVAARWLREIERKRSAPAEGAHARALLLGGDR